jgi:ParB-like chromosome segregation protein Spo0J
MTNEIKVIKVSDVIYRQDLYPRIEHSPALVQQYVDDIEVLPPIEVNQHNELIDGWHRWTAHKQAKVETIKVTVTETRNEMEFLKLAIERNAKHGLQLSPADKKDMALRIYNAIPERERDREKVKLAALLSVSDRTIRSYLSETDKDTKAKRDRRIFSQWLACYTQEEIAKKEGITKETVSEVVSQKTGGLPKSDKFPIFLHQVDFEIEIPVWNAWAEKKSQDLKYYKNNKSHWIDNLLYFFTKPFDVVVDLFGGDGDTIDLCKKRMRRYWVSDRKPIVAREDEIRVHDITDGLPNLPRWKDVKLVYLDPPEWRKARYGDDPQDLGNMSLEDYHKALSTLINSFAHKLNNAYIALSISPSQWEAPDHQYIDHLIDIWHSVKLQEEDRVVIELDKERCTPEMLEWARTNKELLVITRDIAIWKVPDKVPSVEANLPQHTHDL